MGDRQTDYIIFVELNTFICRSTCSVRTEDFIEAESSIRLIRDVVNHVRDDHASPHTKNV